MMREFLAFKADRKEKAWASRIPAGAARASATASFYYSLAGGLLFIGLLILMLLALTATLAPAYFWASLCFFAGSFFAGVGYVYSTLAADAVVQHYNLPVSARREFLHLKLENFDSKLHRAGHVPPEEV